MPHLRVPDARTPTPCAPAAKFAIAAYLNVPVYAEFHDWLGRGDVLQPMWDAWKARRPQGGARRDPRLARRRARSCTARPRQCRAKIQRYFDNGVTTSASPSCPSPGIDHWEAVRALSPKSAS